ncbi:MAG: hypothetical protein J6N19_09940 [Clostridium sp.]|nr:hypothetical protein [Clostridium sp.]
MNENIQFAFVTKDGFEHRLNVPATTIFQAAFEILESIAVGDLAVDPKDIVKIIDIPG